MPKLHFCRYDAIVLSMLLALSVLGFAVLYITSNTHGDASSVEIIADGDRLNYSLDGDTTLKLSSNGIDTVLRIQDGKVWIDNTTCPQQICRHSGKNSSPGDIILCVPAKLKIKILSTAREVDAVAK